MSVRTGSYDLLDETVQYLNRPKAAGGCPWTNMQDCVTLISWIKSELAECEEALTMLAAARSADHGGKKSSSTTASEKHLQAEMGDLLFDVMMLLGAANRDHGVEPKAVSDGAAAKIRSRTPYMGWSEEGATGTRGISTAAEAEFIWQASKKTEKPEPMLKPTAPAAGAWCVPFASTPPVPVALRLLLSLLFLCGAAILTSTAASHSLSMRACPSASPSCSAEAAASLPDAVHLYLGAGGVSPVVRGLPGSLAATGLGLVVSLLLWQTATWGLTVGALLLAEAVGTYSFLLVLRALLMAVDYYTMDVLVAIFMGTAVVTLRAPHLRAVYQWARRMDKWRRKNKRIEAFESIQHACTVHADGDGRGLQSGEMRQ